VASISLEVRPRSPEARDRPEHAHGLGLERGEAVPPRLVYEPDLDIDNYAAQIATTFHLATRTEEPETRASGTTQP